MIGNADSAALGIVVALQQTSAITTFLTDGAAGIYQEVAEQGKPFPLILVISLPFPDDQRTSSDDLVLSSPIFRVVGCCEGRSKFTYLSPLTIAIDAALHKIGFMVDGNRVDFTRIRQYRRTFFDGKHYTQRGFEYKAVTQ